MDRIEGAERGLGRRVDVRCRLDQLAEPRQLLVLLLRLRRDLGCPAAPVGEHGTGAEPGERDHGRQQDHPGAARPRETRRTPWRRGRGAHGADHPVLELGGRIGRREREREHPRRALELPGFTAAGGAPAQVLLELARIAVADAERVLGEQLADTGAVHEGSFSSFARRTLINAERRRVFTVPRGMPSASAISRAVMPRK